METKINIPVIENLELDYFERVENEKQKEFINSQHLCVLCGSSLELRHVVDSVLDQIKEEAHCPECTLRTRARIHSLH